MKQRAKSVSIPELTTDLKDIPEASRIFIDKAFGISTRIITLMREKGISTIQLAERIGKTEEETMDILSGSENLTLKTIAKLEAALGSALINVID